MALSKNYNGKISVAISLAFQIKSVYGDDDEQLRKMSLGAIAAFS